MDATRRVIERAMPPAESSRARRLLRAGLAGYLVVVALVTLGPQPLDGATLGIVERSVAWLARLGLPVTYNGVEAAANVALFVPYGVLGGLLARRRRWWVVLVVASATSAAIETAQRALPTRYPTLQDWLLNTLGAALGLALLALVLRHRRRSAA